MGAFSFRENLRRIQWGRTIGLNLLRAFAAGLVWGGVSLLGGNWQAEAPTWFLLPFVLPIAYLIMLPCYFIAAKIVTMATGSLGEIGVGLGTVLLGLLLAVGDPLVFILHKLKPAFVPAEKFGFLNFALILFVLDPAKM